MPVAFRAVRSGTGLATAEPVGTVQDDVVVAIYAAEATTAVTPATGFTEIGTGASDVAGTGGTFRSYWARRGASAVATNWSGAGFPARISTIAYSGCVTTGSPINASAWFSGINSPASGSLSTTVADCMICGYVGVYNWAVSSSTDYANERLDQGESQSFYDDGLLVSAGSTGTLAVTCGSVWGYCIFALAPAGGGGGAVSNRWRRRPSGLLFR